VERERVPLFSLIYYLYVFKALTSAWVEACTSTTTSRIVIPSGTYQMTHVVVKGPCKAPIEIEVDGTIKAPVMLVMHNGSGLVMLTT